MKLRQSKPVRGGQFRPPFFIDVNRYDESGSRFDVGRYRGWRF